MELLPVFLASAFGLALLAGTFHSIKRNLLLGPTSNSRHIGIVVFEILERLMWMLGLLALIFAAPHPVTIVLVFLFFASLLTAGRLRYREDAKSLNRWVRMSTGTGASIEKLVESWADGCRSGVAKQAKAFVARLGRGESIVDAVRRSKLPLEADTLAGILIPSPSATTSPNTSTRQLPLDIHELSRDHSESSDSKWMVSQQFMYVVAILFLAWALGMIIRSGILRVFDEMHSEFSVANEFASNGLDHVVFIANVLIFLLAVWLSSAVVLRWLPLWTVRWVPWFGRHAIERWRCEVLRSMIRGIRVQQPAGQILQFASQATRIRWIRLRCRLAHQLVESGTALPNALNRAHLVTAREKIWLSSAEKNGNLAESIEHLVSNRQRRQRLVWELRMAWLVPLATVLVGIFVLAHAAYVFRFLYSFIQTMA